MHTIFSLEDFSYEEIEKQASKLIDKTVQLLQKKNMELPVAADLINEFPRPKAKDLAAIIYTSGTTGYSKGVMLTNENIVSDVVNSIERFPIDSNDRFLSILPLSHTFEATGGLLCPFAVGVNIYYISGLPTAKKLLSAIATVRPTGILTVPLVIDKIYRKKILPQFQSKKLLNNLYQKPFFRKRLNNIAGKKLIKSFGGKLRFFMFGGAALNEDVEVFFP